MKENPRSIVVSTRLTQQEVEKIKEYAAASSITTSKLVYNIIAAWLEAPTANNSKGDDNNAK